MHNLANALQIGSMSIASGIFGGGLFKFVGEAVPLSDWEQRMFGPFGLVLFGGSVLGWLVAQLAKANAREEKRAEQHEETIKTLVELGVSSKIAIEKSSLVIESVKEAILKCPGARP
jgi:hypothetical protein